MTLKQKLRQFFDYYMIQTLVALFVIIFAVITLKSMLSPREVNALAISVFDDVTDQDASDELCAELREKFGIDDKYTTVSITSGHDVNVLQDIMVLQVHAANNEADIIIAGEEAFRWLAGTGYLQDLDSVFGDRISEIPKERIVAANGPLEGSAAENPETEITGKGEEKNYGISISGSSRWEALSLSKSSDFIAGCVAGTDNSDHILTFLQMILPES